MHIDVFCKLCGLRDVLDAMIPKLAWLMCMLLQKIQICTITIMCADIRFS